MKHFYLLLLISFLGYSCSNSVKNSPENKNVSVDSVSNISTKKQLVDEGDRVDWNTLAALFPKMNDSILIINAVDNEDSSFTEINSVFISALYTDSDESSYPHYAIGSFKIDSAYLGYLIGVENDEGLSVDLWISKKSHKKMTHKMYAAISLADGGESVIEKSWVVDLDGDEIPELVKRGGSSYLDIDSDESDRETTIQNVEVWVFNKENGKFIKKDNVDNQQELNKKFAIKMSEF